MSATPVPTIRKENASFITRTINSVEDYLEDIDLWIHDENLNQYASLGVSALLNFVLFLVMFDMFPGSTMTSLMLLLISLTNTVFFFLNSRSYQLPHYKPHGTRPSFISTSSIFPPTDSPYAMNTIPILSLWEPNLFQLNLFRFFSPIQVGVALCGYNTPTFLPEGRYFNLLLHILTSGGSAILIYYLTESYLKREKAQKILFEQVYDEHSRFANSFLSRVKTEKGTQVTEADLAAFSTPQATRYPLLNSHIVGSVPLMSPYSTPVKTPATGVSTQSGTTPISEKKSTKKRNPFQRAHD